MAMDDAAWRTDPPPVDVDLEIVNDAGEALAGVLSYVGSVGLPSGQRQSFYMLRGGTRPVFTVAKWRRVEA